VPELDFFDHLPTIWDDTKVLEGEIGKYATVARKNGSEWYIGSLTGEQEHQVKIKCSFLTPGKTYTAYIYTDDAASASLTKVKIEQRTITNKTNLNFLINQHNGLAIRITPKK
jgi:alpha-glucosidase